MNDYQKSIDWLHRTKFVQGISYKQLIPILLSACIQLFFQVYGANLGSFFLNSSALPLQLPQCKLPLAWTHFSQQVKTWAEFSTLEDVVCMVCITYQTGKLRVENLAQTTFCFFPPLRTIFQKLTFSPNRSIDVGNFFNLNSFYSANWRGFELGR